MKKSLRLFSLVMAIVMMLSVFAIVSNAAGETASVTIKTSSDKVKAGDEITVYLNVATNYSATSMRWPVLFSSNFFELVESSVAATEELTVLGGTSSFSEDSTNSKLYTASYTSESYSGILVQWYGASAAGLSVYNKPEGMDMFSFKLRVKDTVTKGDEGAIVVPGDSTLFYNYMVTDTSLPLTQDKISPCEDLTYNITNKTVYVPDPQLVAVENSGAVIDYENGFIRGVQVNTADNLDSYISATEGAEVVITAPVDGRMGTGTTVDLVYNGEIISSYTLIIMGDLNGDALVDAFDLIYFDLAEQSAISLSEVALLACDLTADGQNDASDKLALDAYLIFAGSIDQTQGKFIYA